MQKLGGGPSPHSRILEIASNRLMFQKRFSSRFEEKPNEINVSRGTLTPLI